MRDKMSNGNQNDEVWVPKTRLGRLVKEGEITSMEEAMESGLSIKETEIIDTLIPEVNDRENQEVLDVRMTTRMTDSGRRMRFRVTAVIGDKKEFVGIGKGKETEIGSAIRMAIKDAKKDLVHIKRGCGSWECKCGGTHSISHKVKGKSGSVEVTLIPAPKGVGLAIGETGRRVLELAGVKDIWTKTIGKTDTTINFAKATLNALYNLNKIVPYQGEVEQVEEAEPEV